MERWANKVALVTGAGSGIGAQMCKDLCARNVSVFGLDFNEESLELVSREIISKDASSVFLPILCDLTKEEQIQAAFDKILVEGGGVDILVNCAGVVSDHSILEDDNLEMVQKIIQTNLVAVISCTKKAFKSMCDRDVEGHIVNICSILGHCAISCPGVKPFLSTYSVSKFGVQALNRMLSKELVYYQRPKIRLSNISPAFVGDTKIGKENASFKALPESPVLSPKDVSDTLMFVLSAPSHVQVREVVIEAAGAGYY